MGSSEFPSRIADPPETRQLQLFWGNPVQFGATLSNKRRPREMSGLFPGTPERLLPGTPERLFPGTPERLLGRVIHRAGARCSRE
jgi:hypothetical protein